MAEPRRKTGEPQRVRQPLKIDLLPPDVREAIQALYDRGRTWKEIEEQSAAPYGDKWGSDYSVGFVDWEKLDLNVLEEFPEMRIPKSTLQRWFDLRVRQARAQVLRESEMAREFAAKFVARDLPESNAAVMNAMRDQVFALMQKAGSGDQRRFLEGLNALSLTMARLQRVELQARRVEVDQRKIRLLEEREAIARRKLEAEAEKATKKLKRGELKPGDLKELVQRTFGIAPAAPETAHG
jgi:hypothetical protein